jgi:hypothetical protein
VSSAAKMGLVLQLGIYPVEVAARGNVLGKSYMFRFNKLTS